MKRALAWLRKRWALVLMSAALLGVLGDRAERAVGIIVLFLFAIDFYERFCRVERQIPDMHQRKFNAE